MLNFSGVQCCIVRIVPVAPIYPQSAPHQQTVGQAKSGDILNRVLRKTSPRWRAWDPCEQQQQQQQQQQQGTAMFQQVSQWLVIIWVIQIVIPWPYYFPISGFKSGISNMVDNGWSKVPSRTGTPVPVTNTEHPPKPKQGISNGRLKVQEWDPFPLPSIHGIYLPTWMVDSYGKNG